MDTEQLYGFLEAWINKAVSKGGFNAREAADALNALNELKVRAMPVKEPKEVKKK